MTTALQARTSAVGSVVSGSRRALLPAGWPLSLLFLGFPLWWVTGLSSFIFLIAAVPMVFHLVRYRAVAVPRGFGLWLLFLMWMMAGVAVLWVDAPGAVPGGGASRLFVFGYRAAWYLAVTIVLLYIGNLTEEELSNLRITRLLGFMFVVVVAGGLLGVLAPHFEFRSLMEIILPRRLAENGFMQSAIHPAAANIQTFLGYEEARPIAPFAYANAWGANYSLYLPFFVLAWFGRAAGWRRYLAPVILLASVWPVVHSLDRGLWIGLALITIYVVLRLAAAGHEWALRGLIAVIIVTTIVLLASPLQGLFEQRLATPHSNDRRSQLMLETVRSTLHGSPVLGFGSTRDVQGAFSSIAIGDRPGCEACSVPPFGTQGHLWLVVFSQGFVGTVLFLSFFAIRFRRHRRDRSPYAIAGCCVLLLFALYLTIYDMLEAPLFTVMITLALLWRLERGAAGAAVLDKGRG